MPAGSRRLRVACDTNVLLSMLGLPGRRLEILWEVIERGDIELVLSEFILEELSRNLIRKIKLSEGETAEILRTLSDYAEIVSPKQRVSVIRQKESDNRILECALAASADVLITGNFKHIRPLGSFRGIEILTPREFLDKHFPEL